MVGLQVQHAGSTTVLQALQRAPIFQEVSTKHLEQLEQSTRCRTYRKDEPVLLPGEGEAWALLVVSGSVQAYRKIGNKSARTLFVAGPGELIPSPSARARLDALKNRTGVCWIPRTELDRVQAEDPSLAKRVQHAFAQRLIAAYDALEDGTSLGMRDRVARTVARLADGDGETIRISQRILGSMAGVSRQRVGECLAELEALGYARLGPRQGQITVIDRAALETIGEDFDENHEDVT